MPHLKITCLGGFSATLSDEPITGFRSVKARALLAYLVTESGRAHPRDFLIDLLWPDYAPKKANANFRQTLSRLQGLVSNQTATPPFLLVNRQSVQWNLDGSYELDMDDLLNGTDRVLTLTDASLASAEMQPVLEHYRGDFLAGLAVDDAPEFEHWLTIMREQLDQQVRVAVEHTANLAQNSGDYTEVMRLARYQLSLTEWDEMAHRRLMLSLAMLGRRAEALAQFDRCFEVLERELGVEPDEATLELYEQISQGELQAEAFAADVHVASMPAASPKHQLPAQLTPFIGRTQELSQIAERLSDPNCRLITIVGPGGVGKTSLALEAAAKLSPSKVNGAALVTFTGAKEKTQVASAIGQVLGLLPPTDISPLDHLLAYLAPLDLLLVVDNFEDLLQGNNQHAQPSPALRTIDAIMAGAPHVTLLITSRVRLNLAQEWVYPVTGLSVPQETDVITLSDLTELAKYSAVEMYVHHARRVHADFALDVQNWRAVVRICQLVGGLPLGLQLASAWVRVLSCEEIYQEMAQRLNFLSTISPQIPPRHRSLYALFDSSWQHLSIAAQEAVLHLSIFRGSFDRQAAAHVSGASLSTLAEMIDHSFIQRTDQRRYVMHPLMRQIAFDRLKAKPAVLTQTQQHHARFFAHFLKDRKTLLNGPMSPQALDEIEVCFADIMSAWTFLVQSDADEQSGNLQVIGEVVDVVYDFSRTRGRLRTASELFNLALASPAVDLPTTLDDRHIVARLLGRLGASYASLGNRSQAREVIDRAIGIAETLLNDEACVQHWAHIAETLGSCLWCHLFMVNSGGDLERVESLYQRGLTVYERFDLWRGIANLHNMRGVIAHNMGHLSQARELYFMSHRFAIQNNDYGLLSITLYNLGKINEELGRYKEGMDWYAKSLHYATALNDTESLAYIQSGMGRIHLYQGQYVEAARLTKEAVKGFGRIGFQRGLAFGNHLLGEIFYYREEYDEAAAHLAVGMAVCQSASFQVETALITTTQGYLALRLGDEIGAKQLGQKALDDAQRIRSRSIEGPVHTLLGEISLHRGDLAAAHSAFQQAITIGREIHAPLIWQEAQIGLAITAIQMGAAVEAREMLEEVLAHGATPFHLVERIRSLQSQIVSD